MLNAIFSATTFVILYLGSLALLDAFKQINTNNIGYTIIDLCVGIFYSSAAALLWAKDSKYSWFSSGIVLFGITMATTLTARYLIMAPTNQPLHYTLLLHAPALYLVLLIICLSVAATIAPATSFAIPIPIIIIVIGGLAMWTTYTAGKHELFIAITSATIAALATSSAKTK